MPNTPATLTTAEKIAGYTYAMDHIEMAYPDFDHSMTAPYVCLLLRDYIEMSYDLSFMALPSGWLSRYFPEFVSCMPESAKANPGYKWWESDDEGVLIRLTALEWCIEQAKQSK